MGRLGHYPVVLVALIVLGALGAGACSSQAPPPRGTCVVDSNPELRCNTTLKGQVNEELGLIGYSCTGSARPDDDAKYIDSVPLGIICADRGPSADGTTHGFCCTSETTTCAYDPVSDCRAPDYGYECYGANRPEALHASISCGQGVRDGDIINYCCSGTLQPDGCQQSDAVRCSPRLAGWTCRGKSMPRGEQLGANKSRADTYHFLCPVATPAPNPEFNNYCCYVPPLVPIGGSCVQHTGVPGCVPGRFGFACYGPDKPNEDYLPMNCPDPGFPGTSSEGYPATLYCCDFK